MNEANKNQVGGDHYRTEIQHWDYVWANNLDYFQAQITKYVTRWKKKNGIQDLLKAKHFLDKYIELLEVDKAIPVVTMEPFNKVPVNEVPDATPKPSPHLGGEYGT